METLAGFRASLAKSEGNVPFMYLDANRLVTIGIGHLTQKEMLSNIKFVKKNNSSVEATLEEKNTEFDKVSLSTTPKYITGGKNKWYQENITLILEESTINTLFDQDLAIKEAELLGIHPNKNDYTADVWFAMLDIIFNTGGGKYATKKSPATGLRKFSNFNDAIRCRKFDVAAKESHRGHPVSEERNNYVNRLLLSAAKDEEINPKKIASAQCTIQPTATDTSKAPSPALPNKPKPGHAGHTNNTHKRPAKINRPGVNSDKHTQRPIGTSTMNGTHTFKHPRIAPNGHGINSDQIGPKRQ